MSDDFQDSPAQLMREDQANIRMGRIVIGLVLLVAVVFASVLLFSAR